MNNTPTDGGSAFPDQGQRMEIDGKWNQDYSSGMSLRAYAAIHLRVPNSGIDWLDSMIRDAKRDELAGQALTGKCLKQADTWITVEKGALIAYEIADAMLAEREKGNG